MEEVRRVKCELSEARAAEFSMFVRDRVITVQISRERFESLISQHVQKAVTLVKKLLEEAKPKKPAKTGISVNYAEEAQKELSSKLGRACRIVTGRKKGRIELEYYGLDDLNDLLDALSALKQRK